MRMPPYLDVFLAPVRDSQTAQTVTVALLALMALDVIFGCVCAMGVRHDFSSHEFREGLVRKLGNLGMVAVADVLDGLLLAGLDLGFQPLYLAVSVALVLMETWSLVETFAEMHPELADTEMYRMLMRSKENKRDRGGAS